MTAKIPKFEVRALRKNDRGLLEAGLAVAKDQHCTVRIITAAGTHMLVSPNPTTPGKERTL